MIEFLNLAELVKVRSQFATELAAYLAKVGVVQGDAPNFFPNGFDPTVIRERVLVRQERVRYDETQARRLEAERREAYMAEDYSGEQLERAYTRNEHDLDNEPATTEVVDWDILRGQLRRGIILGDPGFGKSFLLRHEAQRLAATYTLASQSSLPILLRLADIAAELKDAKGDPIQAIAAAITVRYKTAEISDRFISWLVNQITGVNTVLLLDALDEVPDNLRANLRDALARLADITQGTLLLTSRSVSYSGAPFDVAQNDRSCEVELVPFNPPCIARFIEAWFAATPDRRKTLQEHLHQIVAWLTHTPEKGAALQDFLRRHPTIRSLARTPLLLTFLCLVAGESQPLPTSRSNLYDRVLKLLLQNTWRAEVLREKPNTERYHCKRRVLQTVAWHFATAKGRWRDQMPGDELHDLLESADDAAYLWRTAPLRHEKEKYNGLLDELSERDGVLVAAGVGKPGEAVPYLFLHRTIHEYLVARYLAAQPTEIWQAHVRAIGVFDADWIEVLVLLAGCLDNPGVLVATLLEGKGDPFHQKHFVAARCIDEAGLAKIAPGQVSAVSAQLTHIVHSAFARRDMSMLSLVASIGVMALTILHSLSLSSDSAVRAYSANSLGRLGDVRAVPVLLKALHDSASRVRQAAAEALGNLGDVGAGPELLVMLNDSELDVRRNAAIALARMGNAGAIPSLLTELYNPSVSMCLWAAVVLGQVGRMGSEEVGTALLAALQAPLRSEIAIVRGFAVLALGEIRDPRTISTLLRAIQDPDSRVRGHAALAIRHQLGNLQAVDGLLAALDDQDKYVRDKAAQSLGRLGDARAIERLLEALLDPEEGVRHAAAMALGELRDGRAIGELLAALQLPDTFLPISVAEALGELGDVRAVDALLDALHHRFHLVRAAAAHALGRLGDARAVNGLLDVLADPNKNVRNHAVLALGRLGDDRAVDLLLGVIGDSMNDVHGRAKLVDSFGVLRATEIGVPNVRRREVLVSVEPNNARTVDILLTHPTLNIRRAATEALAQYVAGDIYNNVAKLILATWPALADRSLVYPLLRRLAWRMKSAEPLQPIAQVATDFAFAKGLIQVPQYRSKAKAIFARLAAQFPEDAVVTTELAKLDDVIAADYSDDNSSV